MPTIISGNIVLEPSIKKPKKMHFADLLQTKDKKQVLERLHARIDGIGGKNVAMILLKAKEDAIICRFPTEAEFKSEFPDATGCWRSISYYLDPKHPVDCSSVIICCVYNLNFNIGFGYHTALNTHRVESESQGNFVALVKLFEIFGREL